MNQWINELVTEVFVGQSLALPESAKYNIKWTDNTCPLIIIFIKKIIKKKKIPVQQKKIHPKM